MTAPCRCEPSKPCRQEAQCARRTGPGTPGFDGVVDGSVIHIRSVRWCPLFLDKRGIALQQRESA